MARLLWDAPEDRVYEYGIDRGVLYLKDPIFGYQTGIPWNGLTGLKEGYSQDSTEPIYLDGVKTHEMQLIGEFLGSLSAWTYPDAFESALGMVSTVIDGAYSDDQQKQAFGLTFRTKYANPMTEQLGYRIHILYTQQVSPSDRKEATLTDGVSVMDFTWDLTSIPEEFPGFRPTAHIMLDSAYFTAAELAVVEGWLYGTGATNPFLPSAQQILDWSDPVTDIVEEYV